MSRQNAQQDQVSSSNSIKSLLKEYMAKNDVVIQSQAESLRALENQVGKIEISLNSRPQGVLPCDIENQRTQWKENCKVITPKSGTQLNEVIQDATAGEGYSNHNHVKILELSEKQITLEKGKKKNVAVEPDQAANKNVIAKQY
ncbi:hypothetical protein V6Z12_A03G119500 [Gossypium hirsutum]